MAMQWKKDPNVKYTELCMFIDEHITEIVNPGENPELENTIYNYLWLLVKALAIKKGMFTNFNDYDPYAFYAANRLFFALRKNQINQGKVIKGKEIRPIKSCLNYTKALLYPMKVEYQREAYREVISEEFVSKKFDALTFGDSLREQAKQSLGYNDKFRFQLEDTLSTSMSLIDKVLERSPFKKNTVEYKYLKISIMLNCLKALETHGKLDVDPTSIILWKLPRSIANYVKILLKEFYTELKKDIIDCYSIVVGDIEDQELSTLLEMNGGNNWNAD